MRRTTIVPWAIFIFVAVAMIAVIWFSMRRPELVNLTSAGNQKNAYSALYANLTIRYAKPPIYEEQYTTQDVQGVSKFQYLIRSFDGHQITVTAPPRATTDVSYFFGGLVEDGVWNLTDKPPAGNTDIHYTVYIKQYADNEHGDRTITFTDPHYWATTAGRQYTIDLKKTNPNDLLKLQGSQLADPHYQQIVDDFRNFGPQGFRDKVASARATILHGGSAH